MNLVFKKAFCSGLAVLSLLSAVSVPTSRNNVNAKKSSKVVVIEREVSQKHNSNEDEKEMRDIIKQVLEEQKNLKKSDKDGLATFLLALFGGPLGLHRFYVGKIGTGILYLLTGGVFGIGWIGDLIKIVCGRFKDSNHRRIEF